MSLEIVSVNGRELPACTPSLMPFYISYNGSAPVSRYLRPKPAPAPLAAQSSSMTTLITSSSSTSMLSETENNLTTFSSTTSIGTVVQESECGERAVLSRTESSATVIDHVDQVTTQFVADSDAVVKTDMETQPALGKVLLNKSSRWTPRNVERFIAAFRGRQMYGQVVDTPDGYGGLVLRTPLDSKGKGAKDAMASSKPLSQKSRLRSKTRVMRRRSKRGIADDTANDLEGGEDEDCSSNPDVDPLSATKKLIPCSTFGSFMLWAPDRPLDEGKDEYVRALAEWTRLAIEIHSYDD